MNSRFLLLTTALAFALPLTAQAETHGFYIGGAGGADFAVDGKASNGAGSGTVRYGTGPVGLVNLGYGFGNFRAELEGAYRENDVTGLSNTALASVGGRNRTWSAMVNGLYDISTGTRFTPYIGGGVGAGFIDASLTGTTPGGAGVTVYNGSDTVFAYQAIAGVAYAVTTNLSVTADYRYFATEDASISSGTTKWKVENSHHVVTAGLRWSFGAPPPVVQAAAVVPAPPPARSNEYLVFFDWDKSTITAEAHGVITQAAAAATQNKTTIVLVTANTDTSGSTQYNQKLSERRALAVKRDLIKLGVPADSIETVGKGETELSVPTADGVREPQNRRATIVLRLG